ncbi:hypothetical protein [Paenibacillus sp. FSL R5-0345]|uniref:hypothetical protein n=1 Tax=Paenibacillus sp. FSL R5-0345 TaxID=1536770 RepID=UPI0012E09EFB|nr:hypothetical protein [Paenibacillus sp. FSL R5-0345]
MMAAWINLGGVLARIDATGRLTGAIIPVDNQIHAKEQKARGEPPRAPIMDGRSDNKSA